MSDKMSVEVAIEVLANYAETMAGEHETPCDGIREVGECYICSEFQPLAEAFEVLGMADRTRKWRKACATIEKKTGGRK